MASLQTHAADPTLSPAQMRALGAELSDKTPVRLWMQLLSNPACLPTQLIELPMAYSCRGKRKRAKVQMALAWTVIENSSIPLLSLEDPTLIPQLLAVFRGAHRRWIFSFLTLEELRRVFLLLAHEWLRWSTLHTTDPGVSLEIKSRLDCLSAPTSRPLAEYRKRHASSHFEIPTYSSLQHSLSVAFMHAATPKIVNLMESLDWLWRAALATPVTERTSLMAQLASDPNPVCAELAEAQLKARP